MRWIQQSTLVLQLLLGYIYVQYHGQSLGRRFGHHQHTGES